MQLAASTKAITPNHLWMETSKISDKLAHQHARILISGSMIHLLIKEGSPMKSIYSEAINAACIAPTIRLKL